MKALTRGISEALRDLSWTKVVALSSYKNGSTDWQDRHKLDEFVEQLTIAINNIAALKDIAADIPEFSGLKQGGLVRLNGDGRAIYQICIGDEVNADLTILKTDPDIVAVTPSGLKVKLKRAYIALD